MKFRRLPKILIITRHSYMLLLIYCGLAVIAPSKAFSQKHENITIQGTVSDEKGEKLPGVTVKVKGTSIGSITDASGNYTIKAPKDATLTFKSIGYLLKEIAVKDKTQIDVSLLVDTKTLDELVVVGYGTQKKSDITGAVTSISKERLDNMVRTDVVQLIQGAAAGLNVSTTAAGANPESGAVLLIRGRKSISASNDPLIILDGIPYNGSLSDINSSDIESLDILKDASAVAIYGSRASNGVILIQTKQGTKGKPTIKYDFLYGLQNVANFPHLMNGQEYYEFKKGVTNPDDDTEAAITPSELDVYNSGSYNSWTWKDLILRRGNSQQHNLSVSGGADKTTYNVSMSYLGTKGIVINDKYQRINTRINVTSNIKSWLTLGSSSMAGYINNSGAKPSFIDLFNKSPLAVPFNPDGSVNITPIADDPRKINPIENLLYDDLKRKYSVTSNNYLNVTLPFVKGLSYRLNTGVQYESSEKNWYQGTNTGKSGVLRGESETNSGNKYSYTIESIFSYKKDIKKHSIFLTGLLSIEEKENKNSILNGEGFANDFLSYYGITQASKIVPSYQYFKTTLLSQMFRANYAYDSRYLFTFTVRRDGFSGFGTNRKYGVFPSVAVGWNIANEGFLSSAKKTINTLKLRASYGLSGNQAISPYQTLSQLSEGDYIDGSVTAPGYIPSTLGTAGLGWESTKALNLGLDFGFFDSRISGDINVYRNNTNDLLLKRAISAVHGVNSVFQNIGKTRNEGIEITISTRNITKPDFSWITSANFTFIRTKILDLYGDGKDDIANNWFLGKQIKVNYDYKFIGVWQAEDAELAAKYGAKPGYARYEDLNNNGVYDPDDRQLIGSPEPNFTWGLTNNFKYKNFGLSVFMYGKTGVLKANPYKDRNYLITRTYWTPENRSNEFWSNTSQANRYLGKGIIPSVYENADFIRIKDITLNYSFSSKLMSSAGLNRLNIFLTGKNLFTITKWGALDPELDAQRAIPLQREYIVGFNLSF
ncbi:MAG: TonB-dependent receptor [Candidatus Pedobacter colombiensis]|uniref:TonB-dependent receptor n=1 Tax=Candidatus Pedobacter colombiensis TaxID=3121371 RepID=A0AAJ5W9M8_9SPHI|nr:TonB-dependent receptor [Pedobacter sp.]WEK20240.1 MAG: TonB-dependent receptor [Pedobacter sp.]